MSQRSETDQIHLVGTAHVSEESVERVTREIDERRPDVVAVELDDGRYRQLQGEVPDDLEPTDLLEGNTVFQFLAYWMLSYVQTRLGERFDIEPGADMKAAVEAAEDRDIDVALVDRDIQTTMQRFWRRLSPGEKLKLVGGLTLAFGPPVSIGLSVGATLGAFLGFAFAMLFANSIGFSGANIVATVGTVPVEVVGGLVAGSIVGILLWAFLDPSLRSIAGHLPIADGSIARSGAMLCICAVAGLAIALAGGVTIGPLAVGSDRLLSIGGFVLKAGTGVLAGATVGGGVGAMLGLLVGVSIPEDEEFDEFDIERLTDEDVVTAMMAEFRRFSPGGAEALIDERDAFIAHRLLELASQGKSVVAVVGAGHREGIERYLEMPEELPPMDDLVGRTTKRPLAGYLYKGVGYAITLGFVAFFALLALGGVSQAWLVEVLVAWFLVNGILAGGLAKLAGARWSSALVGGGVAWLTSVNPLLAPGWFAGYVELKYRQVNVGDISRLNEILSDQDAPLEDIIAQMRNIPLFRLILVVAMTNIGSMIASFVIFPAVLAWLSAPIGGVDAVGAHLIDGASRGVHVILEALT